jgi:Protein of unknown function (DUF3568)
MLLLAACENGAFPVGGGGTGASPGSGIERNFNGITFRTFSASLASVGAAALKSLNYMDISLTEVRKAEGSWEISATAGKRTVDIQLEALTPNATSMRVVVDRGDLFFKDGATATEIVLQTTDALGRTGQNVGQAAAPEERDGAPSASPADVPAKARKPARRL